MYSESTPVCPCSITVNFEHSAKRVRENKKLSSFSFPYILYDFYYFTVNFMLHFPFNKLIYYDITCDSSICQPNMGTIE